MPPELDGLEFAGSVVVAAPDSGDREVTVADEQLMPPVVLHAVQAGVMDGCVERKAGWGHAGVLKVARSDNIHA